MWKKILPFIQSYKVTAVASPKEQLYEQTTSNPAFTERNIQKANAYLLDSLPEQKPVVTYHTLQSLYVTVWLVNTLTSTAPIGSPIICMWSPADICQQWERNVFFGSADVRGVGKPDEPLRTSAWEAMFSFARLLRKSIRAPDQIPDRFTSSVWNFCRWVADVCPDETSLAARSKEKQLY